MARIEARFVPDDRFCEVSDNHALFIEIEKICSTNSFSAESLLKQLAILKIYYAIGLQEQPEETVYGIFQHLLPVGRIYVRPVTSPQHS